LYYHNEVLLIGVRFHAGLLIVLDLVDQVVMAVGVLAGFCMKCNRICAVFLAGICC